MQKIGFDEAVRSVVKEHGKYHPDAYFFLRDALDYTLKELRQDETEEHRHVNGRELLEGFRRYALNEFGPMTSTVLEQWGIHRSEDVGEMVFQLIEVGAFGRSNTDSRADFSGVYSFEKAFRDPFRPVKVWPGRRYGTQNGSFSLGKGAAS